MVGWPRTLLLCALLGWPLIALTEGEPAAEPGATAAVELAIEPAEATVGDPLQATLVITLHEGAAVLTEPLPASLGPFVVEEQSWSGPQPAAGGLSAWRWQGRLKAFRTGELELPALDIRVQLAEGRTETHSTEPRKVNITSVLDPAEEGAETPPEIADLKPPASLPADFTALVIAGALLAALLAAAGLIWYLQRRFASSLAAVATPTDPFDRTPPHVWVYAELQKLLARRLAEQGHVDLFFAELSRILKRYMGGRYRVELMERTTEEVPRLLRQAGAGERAIAATAALLVRCDRVKFAGDQPDPAACRTAIEEAYAIVDATKPREEAQPEERGAA